MDAVPATAMSSGLRAASRRSLAMMDDAAAAADAVGTSGGGAGAPAVTWHLLDYRTETQTQSNWCWLTVALSLHRWFDRTVQLSQCQVAGHMLGRSDTCANPSSAANNVGGHVYEVLDWLGNLDGSDRGEVPLAALTGQIDARRPVATDVWWSGGGGHSVAVAGYASDGTLSIEDPVSGTVTIDYKTFTTSYQGSGDWGDSYYTRPSRIDVRGGRADPGSRPALVARAPGQLDAFVVGTDGHVYTAAWNAGVAGGAWQGWWQVGTLEVPMGGAVSAVSRAADQLDIFAVGIDGRVYTAAWNQNVAQGKWQGWWPIAGGRGSPGTAVGAVARLADQLDVVVTGTDGHVYTAAWNQNVAQGKWQGWWVIGGLSASQGAPVTIVARAPGQLDVFVTGSDGLPYTAAWNQNVAQGKWQGWWRITGSAKARPTAYLAPVARNAQSLDVFYVDDGGNTSAAAWDQSVANATWRG